MSEPRPDVVPKEWLAAYADDELTSRERDRVENWLAENPQARELLETQESLGRGNLDYWQAVQPPTPTPAQWLRVERAVRSVHPAQPVRIWIGRLATVALLATAASLFFLLWPGQQAIVDAPGVAEPPSVIVEPYAMASSNDVQIISLPESAAHLLVVGEHPLNGTTMALARFGDVEFLGVGSDIAGRFPDLPIDANAQEIPMLWAPKDP